MASSLKVTDDLQPLKRNSSYNWIPPNLSELRIVLLGNSWSERSSAGNFLLKETKFNTEEEPDRSLTVSGQLKETRICLTNTPDLLHPNISEDELRKHIEQCVSLFDPGPHVFLLVLQPEDFTEEQKLRLCRVLQLFGDQSFDCSLVLISTPREEGSGSQAKDVPDQPLRDMMSMCRYRYLKLKNLELPELLTRLGQIVKENHGEHVSCDLLEGLKGEDAGLLTSIKSEKITPVLSLVLCGRRGAGKTSAAKAVLGGLHSESNSSECVKNQGEVCGRQVSVVELPALYGKPQEEVMEESLRCMSLCDPDGVHAFILVLPLDPLTDEDKGELETIQNIFSSRVNDFTLILFTVESDPNCPAVVNFLKDNQDIQELCESCGGRNVVFNIKDKQQIAELLDAVEKMSSAKTRCFTRDMFTKAQMEKVVAKDNTEESLALQVESLKEKNEEMKTKCEDLKRKHEEGLKKLKVKIKEQEGEIVQERKLRAKQLKEKDECINKEREERKKEREDGEKKLKKQEENQRQELKKAVQSEREQKEEAVKKLDLYRKEMKREQEAWNRERQDMWKQIHQEDKQNLEELKTSITKLQQQYDKRRKLNYFLGFFALALLILVTYVFLR